MRHPSVEGWRRNARHRGTVLGKRQLNGRRKRPRRRQLRALLLVSLLELIFEEDAIETRFSQAGMSPWNRGSLARSGNLEQAAAGRVIVVVVPLGSFVAVPFFVVRFTFRFQRLRCARTGAPTHSGVSGVPSLPPFPEFPEPDDGVVPLCSVWKRATSSHRDRAKRREVVVERNGPDPLATLGMTRGEGEQPGRGRPAGADGSQARRDAKSCGQRFPKRRCQKLQRLALKHSGEPE
jgi:hypothetical protein